MENIKKFLVELIKAFDEAGYKVQQPWQVLNAGHYGTPQNRERLILMGARKGEILPGYPDPETNLAGKKITDKNRPVGPTCEDALADIPNAEDYKTLLYSDTVKTNRYGTPSPYAAEMRCLTDDAWHFGYVRDWSPDELTSSARTVHTDISRRRFAETERGSVEPISRFFKLSNHGVSNTLRAGTDASRGAFTSPRPIHYKYPRCVTVREMARLHGFPDWFRFHVTKWHGQDRLGTRFLHRLHGQSLIKSENRWNSKVHTLPQSLRSTSRTFLILRFRRPQNTSGFQFRQTDETERVVQSNVNRWRLSKSA